MYNEIQSQRGQQSILIFLWRLTNENVNAQTVKNASNTQGIRAAELGKCVTQSFISDVGLHWVSFHYVLANINVLAFRKLQQETSLIT